MPSTEATNEVHHSPRIKICGITSVQDGEIAAQYGADALGLVFYEPSPRCVDIATAAEIAAAVGPFITLVGLFVNAEASTVKNILKHVPLNLLQFHGDESAQFCDQFERPYIKAIRMKPELDVEANAKQYPNSSGILLDAYRKGIPGGTGESFDWQRVPKTLGKPIVLAGGLTPDNITKAVKTVKPYAVDVSGGVESEPGVKDAAKVLAFIRNAQ